MNLQVDGAAKNGPGIYQIKTSCVQGTSSIAKVYEAMATALAVMDPPCRVNASARCAGQCQLFHPLSVFTMLDDC